MINREVGVWDPLLRLFHWSLLVACVVAYVTQEQEYDLHLLSGYVVLGLLIFRVFWGLVGPRRARFTDFLFSPATLCGYLHGLLRQSVPRYLGHNPAGGVMVILLLLTLLTVTLSGVALDAAENRAGPLGGTRLFLYHDQIAAVHVVATDVCVVLVVLHLLGVVHTSIAHRENLVRAMITGRKRSLDQTP